MVRYYRHELTVQIFALVLFQDFECRREQRHRHFRVGFLTVGDYPQATVEHLLDVIYTEIGEVDVCQPGEAGEDEDVAHLFQTLGGKLLFHHLFQVVFRKEATVNALHGDFISVEGVNENQTGPDCLVDDLLEEFHALVGGVLAVTVFSAQEELKIHDELVLDFTKGNIGDIVFLLHELHHAAVHPLVFLIGRVCLADTYELLGIFKVLKIERYQRFLFGGDAGKGVLHHFGCNVAMSVEDVVVMFFENDPHVFEALVDFKDFCRASDSLHSLDIP